MTTCVVCGRTGLLLLMVALTFLSSSRFVANASEVLYNATWESLDSRPLPVWYDDAKFGIFLHWGVFSVPSFGATAWFWSFLKGKDWYKDWYLYDDFVKATEKPGFVYQDYAPRFDANLYDPELWADVFAKSGAQYVVPTTKHHEGYCMWNSKDIPTTWNWNVMDIGPKRDLIGDLAKAVKATKSRQTNLPLKFGIYHSLYEWFNPLYRSDRKEFVETKTLPELYDLVNKYSPEIIWSDGDWEQDSDTWKATEFLAWYANNVTTGVWNDRWGKDSTCKHGGFITCSDHYEPGKLKTKKWENAFSMVIGWGWNRNATYADYMTIQQLLETLIETVAFGGNMLLNIGPCPDGTLSPIFVDRLMGMGDWLQVNGEAIYETRPWHVCQNETTANVHYTTKKDTLYAIFTKWPTNSILPLSCPVVTSKTQVRMLGVEDDKETMLETNMLQNDDFMSAFWIRLPALTPDRIPCQHAWVVAVTGVANLYPQTSAQAS